MTERSLAAKKNRARRPRAGAVPSPPRPRRARPGADPIRVLIADDHAFFRRGLETVLQGEPGLELVGQASDGAEAVRSPAKWCPTWC